MKHDQLYAVEVKSIVVEDIPALLMRPQGVEKDKGILFYHGWSSTKELNQFRGATLAAHGYTVIVPDAIHHGDRGTLDYKTHSVAAEYFFPTIEQSRAEFPIWKAYFQELGITDIIVSGHSMGGFTASTIFCDDASIKGCANLNGFFDYRPMVKVAEGSEELNALLQKYKQNPAECVDKLVNRPILILAGEADAVILEKYQRAFYDTLKEKYDDPSQIQMISYPNLGHFLTTNMMEELISFADKVLGE